MIEVLIWQWRTEKNMTLRELAERSGIPKTTLHRLECGWKSPTLAQLERIAKELGIEPERLFRFSCPTGGTNSQIT